VALADHSIPSTLHHAGDGAEALAFLRREGPYQAAPLPDLILLDLNMPRIDGRQVRRFTPLRQIPHQDHSYR